MWNPCDIWEVGLSSQTFRSFQLLKMILKRTVKILQMLLCGHWMEWWILLHAEIWKQINILFTWTPSTCHDIHVQTTTLISVFQLWHLRGSELQWKRDADVYVCVCITGSEGNWNSSSSSPRLVFVWGERPNYHYLLLQWLHRCSGSQEPFLLTRSSLTWLRADVRGRATGALAPRVHF